MDAEPGRPLPTVTLALELYGLLLELDPARFVPTRAAQLHGDLGRIAAQLRASGDGDDEVARCSVALAGALDAAPSATTVDVAPWVALRIAVGNPYEDLVAALARAGHRVPSLRPTNYSRSFFHVCSSLFALFIIEVMTERMIWVAGGFLTSAVLMESSRKISPRANDVLMRAFGKVSHPYERHRVNSASWYALALMLLALFAPPVGCAVGVVVLGFGDPFAATIGRRFGRTRLPGGRSLEGSLAFVVAGTLMSLPVMLFAHHLALGVALGIALAGASAGAVAEVLSGRLDDNFTIPVCAGFAAWGTSLLLL